MGFGLAMCQAIHVYGKDRENTVVSVESQTCKRNRQTDRQCVEKFATDQVDVSLS